MSYCKRFLLRGSISAVLLAGLLSIFALGGASSTAFARPNACNTTATGSWSNNCTTYETNISNFVVAIQTAVNESGTTFNGHTCSTGGIDGDFGPNTFNGVKCFQGAEKIGIDGIVGPQTWGNLYGQLKYDQTISGFNYYFIGNASFDDFAQSTSTGVWWVWFGKANKFCVMNLSSPC